jgi:anti-anti-sigma regulatory factor
MVTIHQAEGLLRATISGEFDFSKSRELFKRYRRKLVDEKITRIEILLEKVATIHSCAIGSMMMLSDSVKGNFHIRCINCAPGVAHLFNSGLLPDSFIFNKPLS